MSNELIVYCVGFVVSWPVITAYVWFGELGRDEWEDYAAAAFVAFFVTFFWPLLLVLFVFVALLALLAIGVGFCVRCIIHTVGKSQHSRGGAR